ncbi:hypothetical protein [Streptomyces mayteni]
MAKRTPNTNTSPSDDRTTFVVVGAAVMDVRRERVGVVMAKENDRVYLRPLLGGREWEAEESDLRPATGEERLLAKLRGLNSRSSDPRL